MSEFVERLERLSPLQRALLALEQAQARIDALERSRAEPVAVVGIGCRFPGGVDDPDAFWRLLIERRHGVGLVPPDRWDRDRYYDPDPDAPGKMYTRHGAFIDRADEFDAGLFGISPREASFMDPQQRLLLEVCWEALERAGIAPDSLAGRPVGAFVGISTTDYAHVAAKLCDPAQVNAYVGTGNAHSIAANRLSYVLGLQGPSVAVDTACSSTLVAAHLACASLRSGECELALVGGANLMLAPETTMNFAKARMLSSEGHCRPFDARAGGYVRGEGCGAVVLERLSDAETRGDRVLAVIRGSAVNQDGRSNGLTAPHGPSQEEVIRRALRQARVAPAEVQFVEAHGTGTLLGDPIELAALGRVLQGEREHPALVGSVKGNIGHLEAAAGIAGLIKAVLVLDRGEIPPQHDFEQPNPHVDWDSIPVRIATERTPLPSERGAVGVSSFGFGGTNAHLVLQAPPTVSVAAHVAEGSHDRDTAPLLVKLSAQGSRALEAAARQLGEHLRRDLQPLAAIARTANTGRAELADRAVLLAGTREELEDRLAALGAGQSRAGVWRGRARSTTRARIAFLVPGQGSRYGGAAAELYRRHPASARVLDELAEILGPLDQLPLAALLEAGKQSEQALTRTEIAQPALYALALALAAFWRSSRVVPDAVIGHSVGAYAAAALAGVFTAADGARLVAARGRLMAELPPGGGMAAVLAAPDVVDEALVEFPQLAIAARNGPSETVIAGPSSAIVRACEALGAQGVATIVLPVSHAFHTSLVEPALTAFEKELHRVRLAAPAIPLVSDTTGELAGEAASASYWVRHARRPVDFTAALGTLATHTPRHLIELGPGSTLLALARSHPAVSELTMLPSLHSRRPATEQLLSSLAQLWVQGIPIDWSTVVSPSGARATLPTYPFQHRRHWLPEASAAAPEAEVEPAAERSAPAARATVRDGNNEFVEGLLSRGDGSRRPPLLALVRGKVASVIGLDLTDTIEEDDGLFQLGLDSLMAVELRRVLEEAVGRELPVTVALERPTVGALTDYLLELLAGEVATPVRRARARPAEDEPVAIVGMGCRLPGGAENLDSYWRLLHDGVDAVAPVPASRWDADAFYDPDPDAPMRMNTRSGGFLRGPVEEFDAEMFGISPREATSMDPQQRLLLEVAWEALEDAGVAGRLSGSRTGVFVGINTTDYMQLISAGPREGIDAYLATGNTFSVAAGRLSYLLGLRGPSLAVDTACSSSLVAIHLACASLRRGESDAALAGGVNLMLSPASGVGMAKLRALSPDGRCKAFDAGADGYGRGEGCGVVVLRRLSDALADGDPVWGVLRGSAVNHDGRSAGLTVPNGPAQEAVIREALEQAGVEPAHVSYVEAHGTGTALGDPIELRALAAALRGGRTRPLTVGSVKTNIGHLEAAAGVAGVIKVVLALRHREIPPHLHFKQPSPFVPWDEIPIQIPTEAVPWANGDGPRVAGVSSFGFSGTNAHVLVEEPPPLSTSVSTAPDASEEGRAELLVLSARSDTALRAGASRFRELLDTSPDASFADLCYTAATRRAHHRHRLALVAQSLAQAAERLEAFARGERVPGVHVAPARAEPPELIFAFCGQGALGEGTGRGLLAAEPGFREAFERCDELVRAEAGWSLIDEIRAEPRLEDTEIAQPLLFAVQVALVQMWRSWGVEPTALVGHSVGEIAAAHVAGALRLEDGVRIVVARGRLMQRTKGKGAMAAIGVPADEARELVGGLPVLVSIAAINGPATTVLSGDPDAIEQALAEAARRRVFARRLPGSYAFHSAQMEPLRAELRDALGGLQSQRPELPIASTVTGSLAADVDFGAEHWVANVVEPVRFDAALTELTGEGNNLVLEVAPHPVLAASIAQSLNGAGRSGTPLASMRRAAADERAVALEALAAMHVAGVSIEHRRRYPATARVARLPSYQWQRQRYWLPERPAAARPPGAALSEPDPAVHRRDAQRVLAEHTYELQWHRRDRAVAGPAPAAPATWLVIGARDGLGTELARALQARGHGCQLATPLELDDPDAVPTLLAAARGPGGSPPRGVVLLWGTDTAEGLAEIEAASRRECGALLALVQALHGHEPEPPRIWLATRGTQPVESSRPPADPAHAPLWGLARVVALEHPELWGGIVDLDPSPSPRDAELLLQEIDASDFEDQVAYRGDRRHVARLVRSALDPEEGTIQLCADARYLVTGGRGALGLRVAAWLAASGARHLVLVGRGAPDEHARAMIERLEGDGVTVEAPLIDVADPDAMRELIEDGGRSGPPLRGVIHAAGVFRPQPTDQMTVTDFERVLRPKLAGSWILHELTSELPLDFFVMFSSAASVWGSALAGHYVAANHFQDVLAHHRRRLGLPALAINWGWWEGSEMVAPEAKAYFAALGLEVVSDELGLTALGQLLRSPHAQRTVAPVDWARFKPTFTARRPRPLLDLIESPETPGDRPAASAEGQALIAQLRGLPPEEREAIMIEYLQRQTGDVLGREPSQPLDPQLGFFEAGMDSITAVELKTHLEASLGISLAATVAFEWPNIAALAQHLIEHALQLPAGASEQDQPAAEKTRSVAELEQLGEDELLNLLAREVGVSS